MTMADRAEPAKTSDVPVHKMESTINGLYADIDRLNEVVGVLVTRLAPVTAPSMTAEAKPDLDAVAEPAGTHTVRIREMGDIVRGITGRLVGVLDYLDV